MSSRHGKNRETTVSSRSLAVQGDTSFGSMEGSSSAHYAHLSLRPATKQITTTTTTTTSVHFAPLRIPRVPDPTLLPEAERNQYAPYQSHASALGRRLDPKLYPLAATEIPQCKFSFSMALNQAEADHLLRPESVDDAAQIEEPRRAPPTPQSNIKVEQRRDLLPSPRTGRKRSASDRGSRTLSSSIDETGQDLLLSDRACALAEPPRKKQKPNLPSRSEAPPSPQLSGEEDIFPEILSDSRPKIPLELGDGLELSTLLSLPTLVDQFQDLPQDLQSHVLLHLLRRSPIPVLQLMQDTIAPALKRDFLVDLPPELASLVLMNMDGSSLCQATQVSKQWHRLVDGDERTWRHRLLVESHWKGDGTDEDSAAVFEGAEPERPEAKFVAQWYSETWDIEFDEAEAARPTNVKLEAARLQARRQKQHKHTFSVTDHLFDNTTAEPTFRQRVAISRQQARKKGEHYVHPFKHLYRRRVLNRRKWFEEEPRRISFPGHSNSAVTCLEFDRNRIIEASDDTTINVYSMHRGRKQFSLSGHEGGIWSLAYLGDALISGSTDRTVRIWDLVTERCSHIFIGHTSTVRCLQVVTPVNVNPDSDGPPVWEPPYPLVISGSRDSTLRIWKLPMPGRDKAHLRNVPYSPTGDVEEAKTNPYHLRLLEGHTHAVRALSAHGRTLVSASYDSTVRVWDILSGKCRHVLAGHGQKVYAVVYDHLREQCMSGSEDGTIRLWSTVTGECIRLLEGHGSLVGLLNIRPSSIVSAAADSSINVWDPISGNLMAAFASNTGPIGCIKQDHHKVLSGSDGTLKMWDIVNNRLVRDLMPMAEVSGVWQVNFDERYCVVATRTNGQAEYHVLDFGSIDHDPSHSPKELYLKPPRNHSIEGGRRRRKHVSMSFPHPMIQGSPTSRLVEQRQRHTPIPIASTSQIASTSTALWPLPTNAFRSLPGRGPLEAFADNFSTSDDLDPDELARQDLRTQERLLAQRPTTSKHYVAPIPTSLSNLPTSPTQRDEVVDEEMSLDSAESDEEPEVASRETRPAPELEESDSEMDEEED